MRDLPEMPADRLAQRREHLMINITAEGYSKRHTTRRWLIGGISALTLVAGGGGAVLAAQGSGSAVSRQSNGTVAVNGQALVPSYNGKHVSASELDALHAAGQAAVSLVTREGACHGEYLLFDTAPERDSYQQASAAKRAAAGDTPDPCAFAATPATTPSK